MSSCESASWAGCWPAPRPRNRLPLGPLALVALQPCPTTGPHYPNPRPSPPLPHPGAGVPASAQIAPPPQHKQPSSPPGEPQLGQRNYGPPRGDSGNPLHSGLDLLRPVRLHDGEGPEGKYSDPDTLGRQSPPLNSQKAPAIPDGAVQSPPDTCTNAKITTWFGFGKQSISILDVSRFATRGSLCLLHWGGGVSALGEPGRGQGTRTPGQGSSWNLHSFPDVHFPPTLLRRES